MNRYEALSAPPSLKNKDLSIHIRMQAGDFPGDAQRVQPGAAQSEGQADGRTDHPPALRARCQAANRRATGRSIGYIACGGPAASRSPYRFFAAEYDRMMAACGLEGKTDLAAQDAEPVLKAIEALEDPWRLQAWAAQFLRVGDGLRGAGPRQGGRGLGQGAVVLPAIF